MSDNDHIDAQWLHAAPPPSRRRGRGCALSLLVLILVLAGVLFYPRLQAWFTPVPAVQIQVESSVLPDTAPNCTGQPAHGRRAALSDARPDGRRGLRLRRRHARGLHGRAARRPGALGALLSVHGSRRAERAHHRHLRLGLSRRRPGAPRAACPDGGRPARRRPGGGLSERALYLYDWLLTHVRYVARETYDQTAYAAVCEGEAVCGGIADAYVYLLERRRHPGARHHGHVPIG